MKIGKAMSWLLAECITDYELKNNKFQDTFKRKEVIEN